MIFCRQCGSYANKGVSQCPRCQADLSAVGHESMSGSAVPPRQVSSFPAPSPAGATVTAAVIAPGSFEYGSFISRFVAALIDGILLSVALGAVVFAVVLGMIGGDPQRILQPESIVALLIVLGICILGPFIYDIAMIAKKGATLGKSVLKLSVVRTNGEPVSVGRCVLRTVIKNFVSGILLIGYLMALFTAKNQSLHDLVADTVVVKSGR